MRVRVHPVIVVRPNGDDGVLTEPEMVGSLLPGEVGLFGAEDSKRFGLRRQSTGLHVPIELPKEEAK